MFYRKVTILIDVDDTIEYLLKAWVNYLNDKYGYSVDWTEIRSWNLHDSFPELSQDQIYGALQDADLWDNVTPMPLAQKLIKKLISEGHDVYLVTSSYYKTIPAKFDRMLFKYFPFIDWSHVIIACNKHMINGDVLIDDGPHNLEGGEYKKILMSSPHNLDYPAEDNEMVRVNNWVEAYNEIQKIAFSSRRLDPKLIDEE